MAIAPFPIQPELTAIAIRYRNASLIADAVLPRVPVGKQSFKWLLHTKEEGYTVPDTRVGRKSRPTVVEFTATEQTASTEDHALDDHVPRPDIDNAPDGYDPLGRAVEGTMDLIELAREVRVGALVFSASTYPTGNKVTLSGTSQWSDFANSNPIDAILSAMDGMLMRPNVLVLGMATWTRLRQHPKVIQAIYGPLAQAGMATREQLAAALEIERVEVGRGFVNTAKKGQTPTIVPVWGKHAALLHLDRMADTANRVTFGFTAQFGQRMAAAWEDRNIGAFGGQVVRVAESVKEVVAAPDLGYYFENAVA